MTVAISSKVEKIRSANDEAIESTLTILTDLTTKFLRETSSNERREDLRHLINGRAAHLIRLLSRDEGLDLVERVV